MLSTWTKPAVVAKIKDMDFNMFGDTSNRIESIVGSWDEQKARIVKLLAIKN